MSDRDPIENATDAYDRIRVEIIAQIDECLDKKMISAAVAWANQLERHDKATTHD